MLAQRHYAKYFENTKLFRPIAHTVVISSALTPICRGRSDSFQKEVRYVGIFIIFMQEQILQNEVYGK